MDQNEEELFSEADLVFSYVRHEAPGWNGRNLCDEQRVVPSPISEGDESLSRSIRGMQLGCEIAGSER